MALRSLTVCIIFKIRLKLTYYGNQRWKWVLQKRGKEGSPKYGYDSFRKGHYSNWPHKLELRRRGTLPLPHSPISITDGNHRFKLLYHIKLFKSNKTLGKVYLRMLNKTNQTQMTKDVIRINIDIKEINSKHMDHIQADRSKTWTSSDQ